MQCERCQKDEATIHLTQVVGGEVKKVHLCAACAEASGVDFNDPAALAGLLAQFTAKLTGDAADAAPELDEAVAELFDPVCPRCHQRFTEYQKSGRLGCPACYDAYGARFQELIRSLHGADQHSGRTPASAAKRAATAAELERLQRELEAAIGAEQYEEAAKLRDRIRSLSGGTAS